MFFMFSVALLNKKKKCIHNYILEICSISSWCDQTELNLVSYLITAL